MAQIQVLRVVLASPGDVRAERAILPRVVDSLNRTVAAERKLRLEVIRWETDAHPGFHPEGPPGLIDPALEIEDCDLLVGIFRQRFGTPTSDAQSGTEHEIRLAIDAWRQNGRPQIMVYFDRTQPTPETEEEVEQYKRVLEFKRNFPREGLFWEYTGEGEFEELVREHLTQFLIREYPLGGAAAAPHESKGEASGPVAVAEVIEYLDTLARNMAILPAYYPEHLRLDESGVSRFDNIRQIVRVVEDPSAFQRWLAEEQERMRATGWDFDRLAYQPARARPEILQDFARQPERPGPPQVPWDVRAGNRFKRAVILGDPGSGKTWLLYYEARRLARDGARRLREQVIGLDELILPVFAHLLSVYGGDEPLDERLVALAGAGRSDAFRNFVREKLKTDRCAVLLDAWDEVTADLPDDGRPAPSTPHFRQLLGQRLEAFARQFPRPRLLITSRTVGYDPSHLSVPDLKVLELLAFDTPQTESFVAVWFGDDRRAARECLAMLRRSPQVSGLARIPLMLTLLCRTYAECRERGCDFPSHRVEIYDACLRGLLRDWKGEKQRDKFGDAYVDAVLELLHAVGYSLFVNGYEQFGESELRKHVMAWLDGLKSSHELHGSKPAPLIAELKRDGVLIAAGEHRDAPLLFLHRTFHEYLTARTLARLVDESRKGWRAELEVRGRKVTARRLVDRKSWEPRWQEVLVLSAGRLRDPAPLLNLLADRKRDDLYRHRLGLAVLCLPEIKSPRGDWRLSRLINRITTETFTLWWNQVRGEAGADGVRRGLSPLMRKYLTTQTVASPALVEHLLPVLGQVNGQVAGMSLLERLCVYLGSDDLQEHRAALEAIGKIGDVAVTADPGFLGRLARMLEGTKEYEAINAIVSIGSAAATTPILTHLVRMLEDPDKDEYQYMMAGNALAQMPLSTDRDVAAAVLDRLAQIIQDPNSPVWGYIIDHIRRILGLGPRSKWTEYIYPDKDHPPRQKLLYDLMEKLLDNVEEEPLYQETEEEEEEDGGGEGDEGGNGGGEAATTLVPLDYNIRVSLEELAQMLGGVEWRLRARALRAVYRNGSAAATEEVVGRLIEILESPDSGTVVTPAILGQLSYKFKDPHWGTEPLTVDIGLPIAALNREPVLKAWSVAALTLGIQGEGSTEYFLDLARLAEMMADTPDEDTFQDAVARDIIFQLSRLVNPMWLERSAAVWALHSLRDAAADDPAVIERLSKMLRGERYEVWSAGVMGLAMLGGGAATEAVVAEIARMLEDARWWNRFAAVLMMLGMGGAVAKTPPAFERILELLSPMLESPNWLERHAAVTALGSVGSAAARPPMVGRLARLLPHPVSRLRTAAAAALRAMKQSGVYYFTTRDGVETRRVAELTAI